MSSAAAACVSFRSRMVRSIRTTNPAFIRCSLASGRPRSANTLPVLGSRSRAFLFGIRHLTAQLLETLPDQVYLGFRRGDPRFGFLPKGMYHIGRIPDGDRIDRTEAPSLPHGLRSPSRRYRDRVKVWPSHSLHPNARCIRRSLSSWTYLLAYSNCHVKSFRNASGPAEVVNRVRTCWATCGE